MSVLFKAVKYLAAALIAFGVARLALHLSVKLALMIDSGALFFVSWFLIAGAAGVFGISFRKTLSCIEGWTERSAERRRQVKSGKEPGIR